MIFVSVGLYLFLMNITLSLSFVAEENANKWSMSQNKTKQNNFVCDVYIVKKYTYNSFCSLKIRWCLIVLNMFGIIVR